uniref:hypothetical protein n=1 Tax=Acidovorax sp. SUPP3334 TaxID=2920881 RepID=UPI00295293D0|nr:hypothetical protein [Acidovorax sp. SUPP3334]BDH38334.1 hypothetical protein AVHM3334_23045 [Acidovorax sp. SUPP3334]
MMDFEERDVDIVGRPLFPAVILEILRKMADDAGNGYRTDALKALRWIAAAYPRRASPAYILTTFFKNPFEINPTYSCRTEALEVDLSDGDEGWRKAEKLALEIVCRRERRCKGTVVAASLKQETSQKIMVFQTHDWGA